MKGVLFLVAFVAAIFALGSKALAVTEYCPAAIQNLEPVQTMADGASTDYTFDLFALQSRDVAAKVNVQASEGWYTFELPATSLVKRRYDFGFGYATVSESDRQRVHFPVPVHVLAAWVTSAQGVNCDAFNYVKPEKPFSRARSPHVDPPIADANPANAVAASPIVPPTLSCAKPFADAKVTNPVGPQEVSGAVSALGGGTTLVLVEIGRSDNVEDASIYAASGNKWYDDAALKAAKQSSYKSATLLCHNAPAMYLFRVFMGPD